MLVDSHAHLNMSQFEGDLDEVMERARSAGVGEILNIGYDPASIDETIALSDRYPSIYAALGIHPHHAGDFDGRLEEKLKQLLLRRKVLALGEVGLDYYRDLSPREKQREVLRRQIKIARIFNKPMIIHCRDSFDDLMAILAEEDAGEVGGIFHAFSGGVEEAARVMEMGFLIGIGGVLTYKNSKLPGVAAALPSASFVLETDCPYLTPVPYRGKRNEPAYVALVAEKLAEIRSVSTWDIERGAEANYRKLLHGEGEMPPSVAYDLKGGIYINVTGSCTNDCAFCPRLRSDNNLYGYNLGLVAEPSAAEMVGAVDRYFDGKRYSEIVFCGYGEPTARLKEVLRAAEELGKHGVPVRLNTNGHGNMIHRRDIVPELERCFDRVSVSLNAPDRETYENLCRPDAGEKAFDAALDFIRRAAGSSMECVVTAVEYPGVDLGAVEKLVSSIPRAKFRIRKYHITVPGTW